jgi:hypothetical protein
VTKREDRAEAEANAAERAGEADDDDNVTEGHDSHDDSTGFEGFAAAFDRERLRLGSSTDAALAALLEAGPEAFEHLLKAAQELLLAAKAVVDAGERAVESHRTSTDAAAHANAAPDPEPRVRRIDLA